REEEDDRGLDHAALVVHTRVFRAHRLRKLRVVGIERLLDLLELTLLVLRKRHSASHEPHAGIGCVTVTLTAFVSLHNTRVAAWWERVEVRQRMRAHHEAGHSSAGRTSAAGRTLSGPNRPAILSTACSASRQAAGRSPSASWVAARVTGTRPLARTPTSRSLALLSRPDPW